MSKTRDIEFEIVTALRPGPATVADVESRLPTMVAGEDRRWYAVALMNVERNGQVWYPDCLAGHQHTGRCVIEVTR